MERLAKKAEKEEKAQKAKITKVKRTIALFQLMPKINEIFKNNPTYQLMHIYLKGGVATQCTVSHNEIFSPSL